MDAHRVYREHKDAFGQQLLTIRSRVALTQIQLAEQTGVHRRSVQKWETGESYPKAEALQRLIVALLRNHAFLLGQERAEAEALWSQASEDGSHALAAFDTAWFARTLAAIGEQAADGKRQTAGGGDEEPIAPEPTPNPQPPTPNRWLIGARRWPSPRCMAVTASLQRCTNGCWTTTAG